MEPLSLAMLVVLVLAGLLTGISILNIFSYTIGHETQLHDLRNHVKELHFQHAVYLAKLNGQIPDDSVENAVELIEDSNNINKNAQASTESSEEKTAQSLPVTSDQTETSTANAAA